MSYEEAFRSELRAFHASITTGAPVRATVEAARADLVALIDAFGLAVRQRRAATGRQARSGSPHGEGAKHEP